MSGQGYPAACMHQDGGNPAGLHRGERHPACLAQSPLVAIPGRAIMVLGHVGVWPGMQHPLPCTATLVWWPVPVAMCLDSYFYGHPTLGQVLCHLRSPQEHTTVAHVYDASHPTYNTHHCKHHLHRCAHTQPPDGGVITGIPPSVTATGGYFNIGGGGEGHRTSTPVLVLPRPHWQSL